MSRIVVTDHISLDGVMQSPAGPEEDTREGFEHGGWAAPYSDEVMGAVMAEGMAKRRIPAVSGDGRTSTSPPSGPTRPRQPVSPTCSTERRSTSRRGPSTEPLPWENSTLLEGDVPEAVARLKEELEHDLVILGSGELIRSLMEHDLIDEYLLTIHPLVLGQGRRLFADGGAYAELTLVETKPTTTGVVIARYERAES